MGFGNQAKNQHCAAKRNQQSHPIGTRQGDSLAKRSIKQRTSPLDQRNGDAHACGRRYQQHGSPQTILAAVIIDAVTPQLIGQQRDASRSSQQHAEIPPAKTIRAIQSHRSSDIRSVGKSRPCDGQVMHQYQQQRDGRQHASDDRERPPSNWHQREPSSLQSALHPFGIHRRRPTSLTQPFNLATTGRSCG